MPGRSLKALSSRRGYAVLLFTAVILLLSYSSVAAFAAISFQEYRKVKLMADYTQARYLAQSGMATTIELIKTLTPEQLREIPLLEGLPGIPWENGVITLQVSEETGKFNPNHLLSFSAALDINVAVQEMGNRLAESMGLPHDVWDAVIDWIDEDNVSMPKGYESLDYEMMDPPRRIKNSWLHSVDELLMIPGFDLWSLYEDHRTPEEKEMYSRDFDSEEELLVLTDEDYILANNLTVYLPENPSGAWKININSAPYHVILALSEFMSPEAAKAILIARLNNGYFNSGDLAEIPELQAPSAGGLTLLDEISTRITYRDRLYKVVVEASIGSQTARVAGIYDIASRKIVWYME